MEEVLYTFNKLTFIKITDFNRSKIQMQLIKAFRACDDPENLAVIYERFMDSDSIKNRADIRFLEMESKPRAVIEEMGDIYRRNIRIYN